ncbi:MAG: NADH-quinone oxidoreductase subunit H, partial [Planctomycetota bacterium]
MNDFIVWFIKANIIYGGLLGVAAGMTLAERKISAWIQYRVGPNRVGPWGVLQPIADGVKFFFKEELVPPGANKWLFLFAPAMVAIPAMLTVAVVPFGPEITLFGTTTNISLTDLDIGAIYIVALAGLGVYGIILGGWASNSKYSLIGGLRASAQMISYELSLILAIMTVILFSGTMDLRQIVMAQDDGFFLTNWNVFKMPGVGFVAFILFVICSFAETNRHPFDFAECEPELVGGFHTEYSSMKFALFFLGEYCAMIVMACMTVTLFLGGFSVPFVPGAEWWLAVPAFLLKTSFF